MDQPNLLRFDVAHPARQKRWLLFLRPILAIPHTIILWFLTFGLGVVSFIAWWAILFTGRYPEGLWNFSMSVMRWNARVQIYVMSLRDEYPPFGDAPYPMNFAQAYPEKQSRLLLFLRPFMLIPHYICLMLVGIAAGVVYIIAWFAVLIIGRMPEGMFTFLVGAYRWIYRVYVYQLMLSDTYPPFSMGEDEPVPAPVATVYAGHA